MAKLEDLFVFVCVCLLTFFWLIGLHEKILLQIFLGFFLSYVLFCKRYLAVFIIKNRTVIYLSFLFLITYIYGLWGYGNSLREFLNFWGPFVLLLLWYQLSPSYFFLGMLIALLLALTVYSYFIIFTSSVIDGRFSLFGLHPNGFGMMLIPVLAFLIMANKNKRFNWLLVVAAAGVGGALYMTNSRTGLISFFLTLATILFYKNKKLLMYFLCGVVVLISSIYLINPNTKFNKRIISVIENPLEDRTFLLRTILWGAAIDMIEETPLVGGGSLKYKKRYLELHQERPDQYTEPNIDKPHNLLLEVWIAAGVLGVALLLFIAWDILLLMSLSPPVPVVVFLPFLAVAFMFDGGLFQYAPFQFGCAFTLAILCKSIPPSPIDPWTNRKLV